MKVYKCFTMIHATYALKISIFHILWLQIHTRTIILQQLRPRHVGAASTHFNCHFEAIYCFSPPSDLMT